MDFYFLGVALTAMQMQLGVKCSVDGVCAGTDCPLSLFPKSVHRTGSQEIRSGWLG